MISRAHTSRLPIPVALTAGLLWLFAPSIAALSGGETSAEGAVRAATKVAASLDRGSAPLAFEPNRGQAAAAVRYLSRGRGYLVALGDDRAAVMLPGAQPTALQMFFANANTNVIPVHERALNSRVNYLLGANQEDWQVGVPTYAAVRYSQLWSGVDLLFHSRKGRLEYDVVLAPGVTPADVSFRFEGHRAFSVDDDGRLHIDTAAGVLLQDKPEIYQLIAGLRHRVDGGYRARGADRLGFWIGEHDRAHAVVIDPVLDYSTYLGGGRTDDVSAVAIDADGNTYVTGTTRSWNFPADSFLGPAFSQHRKDIFVSKLAADGSAFLYSTYVGGLGNDSARAIAVDAQGHVYVAGSTHSGHSFPGPHGHRWFAGGDHDAFIAKLAPGGDSLQFTTVFGGHRRDVANAVALAADGDVVLAGETRSRHGFMVEQALQPTHAGQLDAFVIRLSGDGGSVRFATFLGGRSRDVANALAVDDLGDIYVAGSTASHDDFPLRQSMYAHRRDTSDAFISKLSADGQALIYSTFLGGRKADEIWAIAVDGERRAWVAGATNSRRDFPLVNALQDRLGGATDGFVARINTTGDALEWSTYLGGRRYDDIRAIALDDAQRIWIAGSSNSRQDFPLLDAVQAEPGGQMDAIVGRINAPSSVSNPSIANSSIEFATFLGGPKDDWANAIALNAHGSVVVGGVTRSRTDFPVENALQPQFGGGSQDGFLARYTANQAPVITSIPITTASVGELYQYQGEADDAEADELSWSLVEPLQGMTIEIDTGLVSFTPTVRATLIVTVRVEDEHGNADEQTFELLVHAENQPPQFISTPVISAERASVYTYGVDAQDGDGDSLTYTLGAAPLGMVINSLSGLIEWTPEVVGAFVVVVVVDDGNANQATQSFTLTVEDSVAPAINISEPVDGALTNQAPISIVGTVNESATLTINGGTVALGADGSFSHPVTLSEGSNSFVLLVTDPSGNQGNEQLSVTLDTMAPVIVLNEPQEGVTVSSATVTFAGTLSEAVALSINGQSVSIAADNSFSADLVLVEGLNSVAVLVTDPAGNAISVERNVTVDATPPAEPDVLLITRSSPALETIEVNGGASAVEGGALVILNNPVNGFAVSVPANTDGSFSAALRGFANDTVQIRTRDASGNSSASVNLIPNSPNQLTLNSIGDRIALLGQETRFTVTAAGAGGERPELSVSPAPLPDGMRFDRGTGELVFRPARAQVGEIELTIIAEADGERVSETFTITVPEPLSGVSTTFSGRVLDANAMGQDSLVPLVGVTVSFLDTGVSAVTDADGYFTLDNVPLTAEVLDLDADTAAPGPGGTAYASFREGFVLEPGVDNIEHRPFYLPRLAAESLTPVNPNATTVVNNPTLGVTLSVPPGTARNVDGSLYSGDLSVSLVPRDFAPANMPEALDPALLITIQPVGVVYSEPVPITFANTEGFAPGTEVDLWSVDPDLGRFVIVGTMQVSADGSLIHTVTGGILANDWHMPLALAAAIDPSAAANQNPHKPCPGCGARAAASTFSMHDGHMETNFSLPAYRSLEASRVLTFGYRSFRAYVRPAVELNGVLPPRGAVPGRMSFELSVGGITQEHEIYLDSSTLVAGVGERFRISALFDGDTFTSGMYPYRLRLTNEFQSRVSTIQNGVVMVVNETTSAFGAGWMLMGLDKLVFNADASVTLIAASGDSVNYLADEAQANAFISPNNAFSVFVREPDGSYTHTDKNGVRMLFNAQGQLTERIDRNGNATTYIYDDEGRLFRLIDPVGLATLFAYDANGRLSSVIDPAQRVSRFTHDVRGNLVRIDYPDDTYERFEYDDRHLLTAHEDERQLRFEDRYNVFGRAVEGILPDSTIRAVSSKTAVGLVDVSTGVGTRQSPAPITRPEEVAGGYVDGRSNTQRAELDAHGRTTLAVDELGRVTTHERDADSNATRTVRPNSSVVTRTFDDRGNVLSTTEEFNGARTVFTYDAYSLVTSVTNARDHLSAINRDPVTGNVLSVVNHLGHTTTLEYDARGLVRRSVSPNDLETVFDYNAQGLLERKTETPSAGAAGAVRVTQYAYFSTGLLSQLITPDGITLDYAYDERSKVTSVTDQLGQSIHYEYDVHENLIGTETRNGDATLALLVANVYDNRNRLVETHLPHIGSKESISKRILDENSNLIGLIDPNNQLSSNVYDGFNRLESNTHRLQGEMVYEYHPTLDLVVRLTAPNGAVTEYGYDDLGRRISETSSDRGTLSYEYDVANNVTAITDGRGIRVSMDYDELERVSSKRYPNTLAGKVEDVQYSYDSCALGVGRLCTRVDESGETAFAYDAWGNVLTRDFTDARGALMYSTGYDYDDGDHVVRMTYPSGREINIDRDGVRRMAQIDTTLNGALATVVGNFHYRGDNQLLSCTFGNGVQDTRSYDLQGRLVEQTLSGSGNVVIDERVYSHDANSNILRIDSNVEDNTYTYDALDRLTADGIDANPTIGYGYDLNDNRLSRSSGAVASELTSSYAYQLNSNRIQSVSQLQTGSAPLPPSLAADRELVYNDAGRLFQLIVDGALRAEYLYNDNGQRTHKTVFDDTGAIESRTVFHYDGAGHLISETDAAGAPVRDYIWHESMSPLAQIDGSTGAEHITYLHTDQLMTNRLGTDELQDVVWRWEGEAFGEAAAQEVGGVRVDLRFPGQYVDAESGLFYNYQRYYDPGIGRYLTSDPIGLSGGPNTYGYVSGNPIGSADPSGLICGTGACIAAAVFAVSFVLDAIDAYDTAQTLVDPCINDGAKALAAGAFLLAVIDPTPGNLFKRGAGKLVPRGPTVGGGGTLEKLTPDEITRIQNAVNRSGQDIAVVGSRVNPEKALRSTSDYDYVIDANHATRNSLSHSLPGAKDVNLGVPGNSDVFRGKVDSNLPHVIFHPK